MLILGGPVGADSHDGGPHPERQARLGAVMDGLADLRLGSDLRTVDVQPASRADLERVHAGAYLDELESLARGGGGALDADTFVTGDSFDTAVRAAGAGLAIAAELDRRGEGVGFVVARPPGHHAVRARGMGFCLLNNVAVTAAALAASGRRVLVVDWDVHHGNGTQDIFWDDRSVLYVSTHQWPLYPGTGRPEEVGGRGAPGATVNIPLPPGATGDVVRAALDEVAAPVVDAFAPDWVLVSSGFDAHRDDPLASLALSGGDYADLATTVGAFAPAPGRLLVFLEGGYDLGALRHATAAMVGALLGADRSEGEAPTSGGPGRHAVRQAGALRRRSLDSAVGAGEA